MTGDAICTFTNVLEVATLTLDKVLDDPQGIGPLTEGDFTISGAGTVNNVVLSGAGDAAANEVTDVVPAGSYSITESPISADYDLAINCGAAGAGAGPSLGISLAANDNVTCTLTNTYNKARLELVKEVIDLNDIDPAVPGDWTLSYAGTESDSGAGGVGPAIVTPGTITIAETGGSADYALTGLVCTDVATGDVLDLSGSVTSPLAASQDITLTAGQDVPIGHKIALTDLKAGDTAIKYGEDIGKIIADVPKGGHVHTHNCKTKRW